TRSEAFGLELESLTGSRGLDRRITEARIQKPGLALTGFTYHLHPDRVQILGETEITYLRSLEPEARRQAAHKVCIEGLSCFVVTKQLEVPAELLEEVAAHDIPLLR